jgi:hypothetical protein
MRLREISTPKSALKDAIKNADAIEAETIKANNKNSQSSSLPEVVKAAACEKSRVRFSFSPVRFERQECANY